MQLLVPYGCRSDVNIKWILCLVESVLENPNTKPGRIRDEDRATGDCRGFQLQLRSLRACAGQCVFSSGLSFDFRDVQRYSVLPFTLPSVISTHIPTLTNKTEIPCDDIGQCIKSEPPPWF